MKRSRSKPQARVPDNLGRLWRFFETQRGAWGAANAAIQRCDVVVVSGARWTIICKIHAVRIQSARVDKLEFRASITIWPGITINSEALARARGVSNDKPTVKGWRRQLERKIRRQGYRGYWQRTRWGTFGDFWKTLKAARAVRAEIKRLDNLEF